MGGGKKHRISFSSAELVHSILRLVYLIYYSLMQRLVCFFLGGYASQVLVNK